MSRSFVIVVAGLAALVSQSACQNARESNSSDSTVAKAKPESEPRPELAGKLTAIEGEVFLDRNKVRENAALEAALFAGDAVVTGSTSKARVELSEGSILAVGPESKLRLQEFSNTQSARRGKLRVLAGQFWFRVSEIVGRPTRIDIETLNAVAGIRGTTVWGDVNRDLLCALAGEVEVTIKAKKIVLAPGECAAKMKTATPEKLRPEGKTVGAYLKEVHIGKPLEAR